MTDDIGAPPKVAIVTGGGSGIGRATALRLAAYGYRVVVAGRRPDALDATVAAAPSETLQAVVCDVTEPAAVNALIDATTTAFGRIDVVVNNAGISRTRPFADIDLDEWRLMMAVDVESVVTVTRAALPHLIQSRGSVINVASLAGLGGDPGMTMYNTAKGAVVNLTRSLAVELAVHGIRVNAVAPTLTTTDATADIPAGDVAEFCRRIPLGRAAETDEIASVIAFLAGRDASFITGVILPVDGGLRASSGQPPHR